MVKVSDCDSDYVSSILIIYPNAPLAQLAEQMILDHWVVGSNPTGSAKLN